MGQIVSKKNRRKYGLTPGYTPKLLAEATEEANIPLVQKDGSVRYVTQQDFDWMVKNGLFELPKKPSGST